MKINLEIRRKIHADIIVEDGNTSLVIDVVDLSPTGNRYISGDIIESLITAANDASRFNGDSDVSFVKKIFDAFLSDTEKMEFIELITHLQTKK